MILVLFFSLHVVHSKHHTIVAYVVQRHHLNGSGDEVSGQNEHLVCL